MVCTQVVALHPTDCKQAGIENELSPVIASSCVAEPAQTMLMQWGQTRDAMGPNQLEAAAKTINTGRDLVRALHRPTTSEGIRASAHQRLQPKALGSQPLTWRCGSQCSLNPDCRSDVGTSASAANRLVKLCSGCAGCRLPLVRRST